MVSLSGPSQFALNLGAQAFFVLFVWRMARRLGAVARVWQDSDATDGRGNGHRAASDESNLPPDTLPEA